MYIYALERQDEAPATNPCCDSLLTDIKGKKQEIAAATHTSQQYAHPSLDVSEYRHQLQRLERFLATGPELVNSLYETKMKNLLADVSTHNLIRGSPSSSDHSISPNDLSDMEYHRKMIESRRRGARKRFEVRLGNHEEFNDSPYSQGTRETEYINCVLWDGDHYITSTDIIRVVLCYLRAEGISLDKTLLRLVEQGIFSDLRNLKVGAGARLEESGSDFLDWLYRHDCIKTKKKQKVYTWNSVNFEHLVMESVGRIGRYRDQSLQDIVAPSSLHGSQLKVNESNPLCPTSHATTSSTATSATNGGASAIPPMTFSNGDTDFYTANMQYQLSEYEFYGAHNAITATTTTTNDYYDGSLTHGVDEVFDFANIPAVSYHQESYYGQHHQQQEVFPVGFGYGSAAAAAVAMAQSEMESRPHGHGSPYPILPNLHVAPNNSSRLSTSNTDSVSSQTQKESVVAGGHQREDDRRFCCSYPGCGKRFKRLEHVKRHLRTHTGERPYVCPVLNCRRSFSRSDNLSQHMKIHQAHEVPGDMLMGGFHGMLEGLNRLSPAPSVQSTDSHASSYSDGSSYGPGSYSEGSSYGHAGNGDGFCGLGMLEGVAALEVSKSHNDDFSTQEELIDHTLCQDLSCNHSPHNHEQEHQYQQQQQQHHHIHSHYDQPSHNHGPCNHDHDHDHAHMPH